MGLLKKIYGGTASDPLDRGESVFDKPVEFGAQLDPYKGRPILIVNTASECGFASQYSALETLHQKYGPEGLVVLGFPSNDFMGQEPGTDAEIASVCQINHGVTFPLLPKAPVKGQPQQPLFRFLTEHGPRDLRGAVRWNFEKFLLNQKGLLVGRWRSYVKPMSKSIVNEIERVIATGE
jgi:glutathione peroxidase